MFLDPEALGRRDTEGLLFGIGSIAVSTPRLYEGLRTGTIREVPSGVATPYSDQPGWFTFCGLFHLMMIGIGTGVCLFP